MIHPDLLAIQTIAYKPNGLFCNAIVQEPESKEYGACSFIIDHKTIKFRVAKITPTKIGQFVTLWKRIGRGPIMPFDLSDSVDFFIVSVRSAQHFGQFIFPKNILWQKGFVSKEGNGGKRAMRVYPPWDITDSPQARKTQSWQLLYFVELHPIFDAANLKKLLSL